MVAFLEAYFRAAFSDLIPKFNANVYLSQLYFSHFK
jgi:hypothetical protein